MAELLIIEAISHQANRSLRSSTESDTLAAYKSTSVINTSEALLREVVLRGADAYKKIPANLNANERAKALDDIFNDKETRHRFVFQEWPRRPMIENPTDRDLVARLRHPCQSFRGKEAGNKLELWGDTLFDFYHIARLPEGYKDLSCMSKSTGSKLAKWSEVYGETEGAESFIDAAEAERMPEVVNVYDTRELIVTEEERVAKMWLRSLVQKMDILTRLRGTRLQELTQKLPSPWPPTSFFEPNAYPAPWRGLAAFRNEGTWMFSELPTLQRYIRTSCLPKKLVVHDPWNLLRACDDEKEEEENMTLSWSEKVQSNPHSTRAYNLKLSEDNTNRRDEDDNEVRKIRRRRAALVKGLLTRPHSSTKKPPGRELLGQKTAGPCKPPVFVIFPEVPPYSQPEEGHLYLSPKHTVGKGHHSFVYHAEFEIPRSLVIEELICNYCLIEDVQNIINEEDGMDGERREKRWDEMSGMVVEKSKLKKPVYMKLGEDDVEEYLHERGYVERWLEYEGPYRVIQARRGTQNLERGDYCVHLRVQDKQVHPLTTKVRVAAKLSIQHDRHLQREAENYQQFPKHFFEHWSGFNIVPPEHDPVPVGALVPQFYGYYVPEEAEEEQVKEEEEKVKEVKSEEKDQATSPKLYLSPILLVEHCGIPIKADKLSADDKNECASLAFRFHDAEWLHGSFAQRNILFQPGPLSKPPKERLANTKKRGGYGVDWSFRMVDFGRSKYLGHASKGEGADYAHEHQAVKMWIQYSLPLQ